MAFIEEPHFKKDFSLKCFGKNNQYITKHLKLAHVSLKSHMSNFGKNRHTE